MAREPSITGTSISSPSAAWVMRNGTRIRILRLFALEELVRPDRDMHIQVAVRRALAAGLALAGQADARAILDPCRDRHLQAAFALHGAGALADPAGIADHAALAAAGRAGPLDQEEALLRAHLAGALAGRAGLGRAPLVLRSGAVAASHFTRVGTRSVTLVPVNASARSISTAWRRSAPVRVRWPPPPRP